MITMQYDRFIDAANLMEYWRHRYHGSERLADFVVWLRFWISLVDTENGPEIMAVAIAASEWQDTAFLATGEWRFPEWCEFAAFTQTYERR